MNQNTCTICFQTQDNINLLSTNQKSKSLFDKLKTKLKIVCVNIESSIVCFNCFLELEATVVFLEKLEKANEVLLSLSKYSDSSDHYGHYDFTDSENTYSKVEEKQSVIEADKNRELQTILVDLNTPCAKCGALRRCKHRARPNAHTCPYCQKIFNRKFNFTIHIKRHLGRRDWRCDVCGAAAVTRWLAQAHCRPRMRQACPAATCSRSFTTAANLATHLRTHTGERPHVCSVCSKSFISRDTLRNHLRTHTGTHAKRVTVSPKTSKHLCVRNVNEVHTSISHQHEKVNTHNVTCIERKAVYLWVRRYAESGHIEQSQPGPKAVAYTNASHLHRDIAIGYPFATTRSTATTHGVTQQTVRN